MPTMRRTTVEFVIEHDGEDLGPRSLADAISAYVSDWENTQCVESRVRGSAMLKDTTPPSNQERASDAR